MKSCVGVMEGNRTLLTEFVLRGLTDRPELQVPLFLVFFFIYVTTMLSAWIPDPPLSLFWGLNSSISAGVGAAGRDRRLQQAKTAGRETSDQRGALILYQKIQRRGLKFVHLSTLQAGQAVQEGENPNRLDPQNPVYAEETCPSIIVNGFSERLRAGHIQRIRPNSENLIVG
ncbi:hypothetical protein U0070_014880 [Myodes glareolus]|uniref:Uncharacterized protein n=1 Tax=Myodes glareolus TaxID=447135 RepID=A0AAW0IDY7_MYOGA